MAERAEEGDGRSGGGADGRGAEVLVGVSWRFSPRSKERLQVFCSGQVASCEEEEEKGNEVGEEEVEGKGETIEEKKKKNKQ